MAGTAYLRLIGLGAAIGAPAALVAADFMALIHELQHWLWHGLPDRLGPAVCLGCGFRGGPVFPAIFLGTALATLAVILFDVSPTLAVAAGTAAGMAAMARLLFAGLLLAALLVGTASLDVIPAAVLAAAAAWVTTAARDRRAGPAAATGEGAGARPD